MTISRRSIFTLNDLRSAFAANDCHYPTPLDPELYARAVAEGFEMVGYYVRGAQPTPERRPWGDAVRYVA